MTEFGGPSESEKPAVTRREFIMFLRVAGVVGVAALLTSEKSREGFFNSDAWLIAKQMVATASEGVKIVGQEAGKVFNAQQAELKKMDMAFPTKKK